MYKEDLTTKFLEQILAFRACLKTQILNVKSIRQLADLLIVKNQCISSNFAEVCSAFLIFLTLPVTVASAEGSFSKLKLIKSYLRSTMSQERLSGLAIISIENARATKLELKGQIKEFFFLKKVRKVKSFHKYTNNYICHVRRL